MTLGKKKSQNHWSGCADGGLTVGGVQKAEEGVQQVADHRAELLRGRAVDELAGVVDVGQHLAVGAQRHAQPLHGVVSQVELQLQLHAVLIRREDALVLLHRLVGLAQEVLGVVGAVEGRQVDALQQGLQAVAGQIIPEGGQGATRELSGTSDFRRTGQNLQF